MDVFRTDHVRSTEVCAAVVAVLLISAGLLPPASASDAGQCFTASDVAGSVLGTFFSTLAAIAIAFIVYWFLCRKRRAKARLSRSFETDVEAYARVNPAFQDDEPDKPETAENGKPLSEVSRLQFIPDAKVPASNAGKGKKAKPAKTNPFSVFGNKGTQPTRAQDDSCLHQEPERLEVSLRGSDFTGLGFNIYGNIRNGIYVRDVLHRGPASESGKIKADDRITSVTVSFDKITIEDALTILSYASPYDVTLELQKTSEQPGFVPGHQKKGSTASSASGSLNAAASDRLAHPMYRSQSSDDVSQFGRDATGKKSSLSVGVPAKLKKDTIVKPSHALHKETINEGEKAPTAVEGVEQKQPRINPDNLIVATSPDGGHSEVKVVVHKQEKPVAVDIPDGPAEKPKSSGLGSLKRLGNQIGGFMKEIVSSSSSSSSGDVPTNSKKEEEIKRGKSAPEKPSTNPFEVHVNVVDGKAAAKQKGISLPGATAKGPGVSQKMSTEPFSVDIRGPHAATNVPLPINKMIMQLPEADNLPPKATTADKGLMMDVEEQLAKVGVSLSSGSDVSKDESQRVDIGISPPEVAIDSELKPRMASEFNSAQAKLTSAEDTKNPFDVTIGRVEKVRDDLHSAASSINVDLNVDAHVQPAQNILDKQAVVYVDTASHQQAPELDISIPAVTFEHPEAIHLPLVGDLPSQLEEFNKEVSGLVGTITQNPDTKISIPAVALDDIKVEIDTQSNAVKESLTDSVEKRVSSAIDTTTDVVTNTEVKVKGLMQDAQADMAQTKAAVVTDLQELANQLEGKIAEIQNATTNLASSKEKLEASVSLPQSNILLASNKHSTGEHAGKKKPFNPNRNGIADFDGVVVALPSMADSPVPEMGSEVTVTSSSPPISHNNISDILAEAKSSAEQIIRATMTDLQNSSEVVLNKTGAGSSLSTEEAALPVVEIKAPLLLDSNKEMGFSGKDKAPSPPSLSPSILDATLDENINYFETKMQTVLQKGSPKAKPKRTSTPGKRKAPPPPAAPNGTCSPDDEFANVSGNPFVVGLNSSINDIDVDVKTDNMSVVFLKPDNVTTVQVNATDCATLVANLDTRHETNHLISNDEPKSKKGSSKIDANCGFGFRKTNFLEGLDKAGNDDLLKKVDGERFHSIPRTGLSVHGKVAANDEKNSCRRSSSLGDLTKIHETNSTPLPLERAVSMDLTNADEAVGQLGNNTPEENGGLEPHNSSDETLLSNIDIDDKLEDGQWSIKPAAKIPDTVSTEVDLQNSPSIPPEQDLEQWIDEKQANKQPNKKFNIIQGLFKKDKGTKRKKKEATSISGKSKIPVPVNSVSVLNSKEKPSPSAPPMEESRLQTEIQETSVDLDNDKDGMFEVSLSERDMSLSSSSLSGDSLEEEKDLPAQAMKRRMVAAEGEEHDEEHAKAVWKRESFPITFPVIPPIIREKREMRTPEAEKDGNEASTNVTSAEGIPAKQPRLTGDIRSLSPTKFPRIWPAEDAKESKENGESEETNGNGSSDNPFHYTVNYKSHHNNHSDDGSNSESVTVTTMHITKTNLSSDLYTAYPVTSQGTVSKVIIATPQLTLPVEPPAHAAGPESPPPTLQPLE